MRHDMTLVERLILINQYRLLQQGGSESFEKEIEALREGHEDALDKFFEEPKVTRERVGDNILINGGGGIMVVPVPCKTTEEWLEKARGMFEVSDETEGTDGTSTTSGP